MSNIGPAFVAIVGGIIGLAIIAVLVSKQAQTPQVFQSAGNALANIINSAVSPVASSGGGFGSSPF